ncbi:MAG: PKD domain-containing protein [Saprospiraceae bacterium]
MRIFFILFLSINFLNFSSAQLANGSYAPDFSVTDINGNGWSLYAEMSGGRSACLDFSATWCAPCWNFHQSHVLDQVVSNLSAYSSVAFLEADFKTNTNCLYGTTGCVGGTQGNWVAGTNYPIVDLSNSNGPSVNLQYNITYFPTLYMISPDFRTWINESRTYQEYYDWIIYSFALAATATVNNSPCGDNGSILLDVSGGYGNKKYKWSNGSTSKDLVNIAGGNYKVTISDDNGYFKIFGPWNVVGPQKRIAITSSSQTDIKCFGEKTGNINIGVSFGTPGYNYVWSNGSAGNQLDNLESGNYTVTVTDANSCTITKSFFIAQPALLSIQLTGFPETCDNANGFISIVAKGGVSPFLYYLGNQKNNTGSFQKLKGGNYTIDVVDYNKCKVSEDITINATHKPKLIITAATAINCIADTIILDAQSSDNGNEFITEWSSRNGKILGDPFNINVRTAKSGTYQLKIKNTLNQCESIDSVIIKEDKKYPDISITGEADLNCILPSTILSGSTKNLMTNYYWTKLNTNFKDSSANILISNGGDYVFNVKDTINQCLSKDTVQIKEDKLEPNIEIELPKILNCDILETNLNAANSDQSKEIILNWFSNDGHFKSDDNTLNPIIDKPGTYILSLKNSVNGCESVQAITVQQDTLLPEVEFNNLNDISCIRSNIALEFPITNSKDFEYLWTTMDGNIKGSNKEYKVELDKGGAYNFYFKNLNNHCDKNIAFNIREQKILEPQFDLQRTDLVVNFIDNTQGIVTSRFWDFGDGSTSSEINPIHTYVSEGEYQICLELNNECGLKKLCKNISLKNSAILNLESWYLKPVSCFGNNDAYIKLEVKGGVSPYAYLWNNGETGLEIHNLVKGNYSVTITDAINNKLIQSFLVVEPDVIETASVDIKHENAGFKDGSIEVKLSGGVPVYQYSWSNGLSTEKIDQLSAGQYSLVVKDNNLCEKYFGPFEVKSLTSVKDYTWINSFEFSPNPLNDEGRLSIEFKEQQIFSIQLLDNLGRVIKNWSGDAKVWSYLIDGNKLSPGAYYIKLITSSGQRTKLIIKS